MQGFCIVRFGLMFWTFEHSDFGFVSDFGFRYSDFLYVVAPIYGNLKLSKSYIKLLKHSTRYWLSLDTGIKPFPPRLIKECLDSGGKSS